MRWLLLVIFLSGCTVVMWSDNVTVFKNIKPDAEPPPKKVMKDVNK